MGTSPASKPKASNAKGRVILLLRRFWPRMQEYQTSLADLADRISQLEEALRILHERYSQGSHPLLDEDRLRIKEPFLRQARGTPDPPETVPVGHQASSARNDDHANELAVSLETLSVSELGRSRYTGTGGWLSVSVFHHRVPFEAIAHDPLQYLKVLNQNTGMLDTAHVVLQTESSPADGHRTVLAVLPPEISFIAACFTHSLLPGPEKELQGRLATIRCFLPASEEVLRFKAIFYSTCTFVHDPVPEETFDSVFTNVYESPWSTSGWDEDRVLHVHAVMFMFLSLASVYDTALPLHVSGLVSYPCTVAL
jgi:hypothetical protein